VLATGQAPDRKVQAALMRGHRAPATLAALDALEWLAGARRAAYDVSV
jgi:hypothetical protein